MSEHKEGSRTSLPASSPIGLRELLDATPDLLFACDAHGRFQWLNPSLEPVVGQRPSDLIGKSFTSILSEADRVSTLRAFVRQCRSRASEERRTLTVVAKDGSQSQVLARVRCFERQDGELAFVGVARPLAAWNPPAAVDALRPDVATPSPAPIEAPSAAPSAPADDAKLAALGAEIDTLKAQVQLKAEFLATMSQEIRSPMNGIMGTTQLLLESEMESDQRNLVELIQNQSRALLVMINDTLDFSRLDGGDLKLENIGFDLRITIEEVMAVLTPLALDKSLALECRVHHEVPSRLMGDPGRIRQVLLNLGHNAIKFSEQGRVTLDVERVREDDDEVALRFAVSDSAAQLADDTAVMVSTVFSGSRSDGWRRYGGTGLGLSMSSQIVQLMRGQVGVDSRKGQGNTCWFSLTLPKQKVTGPAAAPSVQLRGVRALVVDPSRAARESLKEMLTAWGCRADEVESGEDALGKLREAASGGDPYRVALIEMNLSGIEGEQLGAAIRSDERLRETRTVLLTAVGRKGDARRAKDLGFSAYLLKPVQWAELYDATVELLGVSGGPEHLVTRHSLAEARRGRFRVLVVEDNPVNQLVASWALQRLGYTIESVVDAKAALETCERQRYDAILMDVQMPGMDGCTAAAALRARERGGPRTPILGMNGSPLTSERERCLAAGMDDVLKKPIDLGELCAMVERLASPNAVAPERPVAAAPAEPEARALTAADVEVVPGRAAEDEPHAPIDNVRLEESCMSIASLREALLQTWLADVGPRMVRLAETLSTRDARRLEFEAHGLAGMSATIGAMDCMKVFEELEHAGRDENLADVASMMERAQAAVERTEAHIKRLEEILRRAA